MRASGRHPVLRGRVAYTTSSSLSRDAVLCSESACDAVPDSGSSLSELCDGVCSAGSTMLVEVPGMSKMSLRFLLCQCKDEFPLSMPCGERWRRTAVHTEMGELPLQK